MSDLTRTLAIFGASLAVGLGCPGPIAPPLVDAGADAATTSADAGQDPGADSGIDAGAILPDAGPTTWLTDNLLYVTDGGVRVEQVTYTSGSLAINGEVCRPNDAFPHPLVMYNHGGFQGLGGYGDPFCVNLAAAGYIVGASSYRGEDGSGGQVEVCLGEVTDVSNMMSVLKAQPYVIPSRVAALGASHGGCITTALAIQDPTLKAAIDFFGPSDLPTLYTFWENELANGEPPPCPPDAGVVCTYVHNTLINTVTTATGGTPTQVPAAYSDRSTVNQIGTMAVPLMLLQGTDDYLVSVDQACEKRDALVAAGKTPASWYLDVNLSVQNPTTVCGGNFSLSQPPAAGAWSQDLYFLVFQGQGHGFTGAANDYATAAAIYFLLGHL